MKGVDVLMDRTKVNLWWCGIGSNPMVHKFVSIDTYISIAPNMYVDAIVRKDIWNDVNKSGR